MSFKINPPNFSLVQDIDDKIPVRGAIDFAGLLPPMRKPKSKIGTDIVIHPLLEEFARQNIKGVSFLFSGGNEVTLVDKAHGSVTLTKKNNDWWGNLNNVSFKIGSDFDVTFWYKDQDETSVKLLARANIEMKRRRTDAVDPTTVKRK